MQPPVTWRNRTQDMMYATGLNRRSYSNNFPAGPYTSLGNGTTGQAGMYKVCYDNIHPNFINRLTDGEVIMGDVILAKTTRDFTSGSIDWKVPATNEYSVWGDFGSQVMGMVSIPDNLSDAAIASEMDAALIEAFAKITKDQVMSSEILLGLGTTVNMLRSPFSQSRELFSRMAKCAKLRYGKTTESVARANASAWLEYRYGVLPLYLDINQSIKTFGRLYQRLERRRTVVRAAKRVESNVTIPFEQLELPVVNNIGFQFYASGSALSRRSAVVSSGVVYEVKLRNLAEEIAAQFGLGTSAVLPGLWEQVPFSFVADWYFGIGDWLAANNLPPGVSVKGNWLSVKRDYDDTYIIDDLSTWSAGIQRHGTGGAASKRVESLIRRTNVELPTLPVVTQRWATITHALDAAALLLSPVRSLIQALR